MGVEIECQKEIIDTCGIHTAERQEAQMEYGALKGELERRISLSIGFEAVGGGLE